MLLGGRLDRIGCVYSALVTDFSVVLFRPNFMLVSEEYPALHQKSGHKTNSFVNESYPSLKKA